jgi:hypothetical protein
MDRTRLERHDLGMAKTTTVHITDDLDGSKDATEIAFSFKGVDYVIDLSKKNSAAMEKALKPYLEAATKVSGRGAANGRRRNSKAGRAGRDVAQVREWARAQGIEVSDRGRVPAAVVEQYDAAH